MHGEPESGEPVQRHEPEREAYEPGQAGEVLFVDDEITLRELAQDVLHDAGFEVCVAIDGGEAVETFAARARHIGAVVLDLTTPRLNGVAACRRIHAIRPDVPVILTSGYSESQAIEAFDPGELAGFLAKPYSSELLIATVRCAMGRGQR